jgi:hypothetical protein
VECLWWSALPKTEKVDPSEPTKQHLSDLEHYKAWRKELNEDETRDDQQSHHHSPTEAEPLTEVTSEVQAKELSNI